MTATDKKIFSFGLLGAGRIGKVHGTAIASNANARLAAVADAHAPSAHSIADAYGADVRTIEAIEAADDIDAVIIATPTDTHADLIERFARAGKAIFCEKPVDLNYARVQACLKVADACGVPLMLGFNRRFDPHFAALQARVAAGDIGEIEQIQITSRDPDLPHLDYLPVSGGLFRDMMIHDFDMARFLLNGDEPEVKFATGSVLVNPKVKELGDVDTAMAVLGTASGKQVVITNSRRATYGYDQRIEVHGSKGMIAAENQRPISIEIATEAGYTRPPLHDFFMTRYVDAYAAEIATFIDCMITGDTPSPSGIDGLKSLALADAATAWATENATSK